MRLIIGSLIVGAFAACIGWSSSFVVIEAWPSILEDTSHNTVVIGLTGAAMILAMMVLRRSVDMVFVSGGAVIATTALWDVREFSESTYTVEYWTAVTFAIFMFLAIATSFYSDYLFRSRR